MSHYLSLKNKWTSRSTSGSGSVPPISSATKSAIAAAAAPVGEMPAAETAVAETPVETELSANSTKSHARLRAYLITTSQTKIRLSMHLSRVSTAAYLHDARINGCLMGQ
ncbi:hypothetical protein FALCPG4_017007 [Fusarium falciforme]